MEKIADDTQFISENSTLLDSLATDPFQAFKKRNKESLSDIFFAPAMKIFSRLISIFGAPTNSLVYTSFSQIRPQAQMLFKIMIGYVFLMNEIFATVCEGRRKTQESHQREIEMLLANYNESVYIDKKIDPNFLNVVDEKDPFDNLIRMSDLLYNVFGELDKTFGTTNFKNVCIQSGLNVLALQQNFKKSNAAHQRLEKNLPREIMSTNAGDLSDILSGSDLFGPYNEPIKMVGTLNRDKLEQRNLSNYILEQLAPSQIKCGKGGEDDDDDNDMEVVTPFNPMENMRNHDKVNQQLESLYETVRRLVNEARQINTDQAPDRNALFAASLEVYQTLNSIIDIMTSSAQFMQTQFLSSQEAEELSQAAHNLFFDFEGATEEASAYILSKIPLIKALIAKMTDLYNGINTELQIYYDLQLKTLLVHIILDSNVKMFLQALHSRESTVIYNMLAFDVLKEYYIEEMRKPAGRSLYDVYENIFDRIQQTDTNENFACYYLQLCGLAVVPLEHIVLKIRPVEFFDNKDVDDRYLTFYKACVKKLLDYINMYAYFVSTGQVLGKSAPAPNTVAENVTVLKQIPVKQTYNNLPQNPSLNASQQMEAWVEEKLVTWKTKLFTGEAARQELTNNANRYIKCISSIGASRDADANVLRQTFLYNFEFTSALSLIQMFLDRDMAAFQYFIKILDFYIGMPDYGEVYVPKAADAKSTFNEVVEADGIPIAIRVAYIRLLIMLCVFYPDNESAPFSVDTKTLTVNIKDASLGAQFLKLYQKKLAHNYLKDVHQIEVKQTQTSLGNVVVSLVCNLKEAEKSENNLEFSVKPEFYQKLFNGRDANTGKAEPFPDLRQYLVERKRSPVESFKAEPARVRRVEFSTLSDRLALLNSLKNCIYTVVNFKGVNSNEGDGTISLTPIDHMAETVIFNVSL
jgi:hypothetical protein